MEKILVSIGKDGEITIEAQGYKGKGCLKAVEKVIAALGGGKTTLTPDYQKAPEVQAKQTY